MQANFNLSSKKIQSDVNELICHIGGNLETSNVPECYRIMEGIMKNFGSKYN